MKTDHWIGFVRRLAREAGTRLLTLRFAAGHACGVTIFALPRFVGDRRHTVCVLNEAGDIVTEEAIAHTREVLTAFCARYPGATVIMETGTHSPGFRA